MKLIRIYLLPLLLSLTACHEMEQTPEPSFFISELIAETGQMQIAKTLGEKENFVNNDEVHLFGFVKPAASATRGVRFMPDNANYPTSGVGLTYTYIHRDPMSIRGHRFGRTVTDPADEVGFWRVGQYHDFVAYYFASGKPTTEQMIFSMDDDIGLSHHELLWGEATNYLFRGDAVVRPEIEFKHKLSRIRVELVHDMDEDDFLVETMTITGLEIDLNRKHHEFDVVEGIWTTPTGGAGTVTLKQTINEPLENIPVAEVKEITDGDWWTTPDCGVTNFILHYTKTANGGSPVDFSVPIQFGHNDNLDDLPVIPTTQEGYITVLRLHINGVKPIIFTVELMGWNNEESHEIVIDDETEKIE